MVSVASSDRGIAKAIGIGTIGHTGICSGSSVTKTVRIGSRTVSIAPGVVVLPKLSVRVL